MDDELPWFGIGRHVDEFGADRKLVGDTLRRVSSRGSPITSPRRLVRREEGSSDRHVRPNSGSPIASPRRLTRRPAEGEDDSSLAELYA